MTNEEILKHPLLPGQDVDIEKFTPYATFVDHAEPVRITFSERPGWKDEPWLGRWKRDPFPEEYGKVTGYFAPPKEGQP